MTSLSDLKTTIRRNKMLGLWAAKKLGLSDSDSEAYSDGLAVGTVHAERGDVLSILRNDFDKAGVRESDEQILRVMNELMLQAGNQQVSQQGHPDAAAVMLVRKLTSR